jgi:hypothetical protein
VFAGTAFAFYFVQVEPVRERRDSICSQILNATSVDARRPSFDAHRFAEITIHSRTIDFDHSLAKYASRLNARNAGPDFKW